VNAPYSLAPREPAGPVLVASHAPDIFARIRSVALRHGIETRFVPVGQHADAVLKAGEGAILLLDLRMGGPLGAGSVAALRCDPRLADAPVIALVGDQEDATARDAVSAGADDFLRESWIERELALKVWLVLRRRADSRIVREEEIAARNAMIVELAGTAAHELNQPLTVVLGYAQLLARRLDPADPLARHVLALEKEARRMAEIIKKLGRITRYETIEYLEGAKIIDLDRSAPRESGLS